MSKKKNLSFPLKNVSVLSLRGGRVLQPMLPIFSSTLRARISNVSAKLEVNTMTFAGRRFVIDGQVDMLLAYKFSSHHLHYRRIRGTDNVYLINWLKVTLCLKIMSTLPRVIFWLLFHLKVALIPSYSKFVLPKMITLKCLCFLFDKMLKIQRVSLSKSPENPSLK